MIYIWRYLYRAFNRLSLKRFRAIPLDQVGLNLPKVSSAFVSG